ncbi:hypothetical protein BKA70DRAFT_1221769 [Coprinopsis sp. MPI-PUGE-AT-0042]|nr:hypothetical protein BKA70DRAFT_1221769 [Coprinopsis sp. MPI-PUGE-AT-0042]
MSPDVRVKSEQEAKYKSNPSCCSNKLILPQLPPSIPMSTDILALAETKHLTNPTEAEIEEATSVLREALKDDPSTPIFSGRDPELARLKIRTGVCAAAIGGALHVIIVPASSGREESIIGVAAWYPPGTSSSATPEQLRVGRGAFFDAVDKKNPKLKAWWADYFIPHYEKAYASALPPSFAKDAWQLQFFGVLPIYQGKGLGKRLFKLADCQAQATKTPIVLETGTELDIIIYRRLGLEVVGDMTIESEYGDQKLTIMVKQWH